MDNLDKNLFYTGAFTENVILSIKDLRSTNNVDDIISRNLKETIENRCIKHGFVEKNSVKIIKRSIGKINSSRLDGTLTYSVFYSANICNPSQNQIIKCIVKDINKMGILAENFPITCVIPRETITTLDEFSDIENGSTISVKIIGVRFDLYDKQITTIGKLES